MIAIPLTKKRIFKSIKGKISEETRLKSFNLLLRRFYILQKEGLIEGLTVVIKPNKLLKVIRIRIDTKKAIKDIDIYLRTFLSMQKDEVIDFVRLTVSFIDKTSFCPFYRNYY